MRNMRLFPKLAAQSIRNNRKFYLPYILALLGDAAAMYIMYALANDPGVVNMTPGHANGYMYVEMFMNIGLFIAALFSAIFVRYVNGFLMKRRKKELGLYNILGMGKRHIAMVLVVETLIIGALGIGGGIIVGLILHKLVSLLLHRVMWMPVPFGFYISWDGIAWTALVFAILLAYTLLVNLNKVRLSKPVELLRSGNVGEREPKTRWLMTGLGVVTLGAGYYIAVTARTGMEALAMYFVAVGLVIVGTYCLFAAVSIFVLKALRRNKKFYYQTGHFISVSGMLYRMNQNAVGLANICILCTMVMVMLSGTLSLYLGTADMVREQVPGDINIRVNYVPDPEDPFKPDVMLEKQLRFIETQGIAVNRAWTSQSLNFSVGQLPDGSYTTDINASDRVGAVVTMSFTTEESYTAITGETLGLATGEIAAYGVEGGTLTIRWAGQTDPAQSAWPAVKKLGSAVIFNSVIGQTVTVVVPDEETLNGMFRLQSTAYGSHGSNIVWYAYLDLDCDEDTLLALRDSYEEAVRDDNFYAGTGHWYSSRWNLRSDTEADAYGLAGGFLFLGLFLGFIFLMATVLIIYYKQISEGYEDKERFEIMQKVGLSRGEVKRSIHTQILMVFFLPIVVAAIHIVFDFNMVEKLLTMFMIHNTLLTALCTAGTVLVFFAVYGAVYLLTARMYYKIVER